MTHHVSCQELPVYQMAFQGSVDIYHWAQPRLETSDADLIRQGLATSLTVRAHIARAWGQRRHRESFIAGLSTAQLEAAEMQIWIENAVTSGYLDPDAGQDLYDHYRRLCMALDQLMAIASISPILLKKTRITPLPATA